MDLFKERWMNNSPVDKGLSRRSQVVLAIVMLAGLVGLAAWWVTHEISQDRALLSRVKIKHPEATKINGKEDQVADYYLMTLTNRDGTRVTTQHDGSADDEVKLKQLSREVFAKHPEASRIDVEQKHMRWCAVFIKNRDGTTSVYKLE